MFDILQHYGFHIKTSAPIVTAFSGAHRGGGDGAREDELGRSQSIHIYPFDVFTYIGYMG